MQFASQSSLEHGGVEIGAAGGLENSGAGAADQLLIRPQLAVSHEPLTRSVSSAKTPHNWGCWIDFFGSSRENDLLHCEQSIINVNVRKKRK